MTIVDLKDAFFTVPVHNLHKNFLYLNRYGNSTNLLVCQMDNLKS